MRLLLLITLASFSMMVGAQDVPWYPLEGEYALSGENILDPDPNSANDSHFRMSLQGETAQNLWHAVNYPALKDGACELPHKPG